MDKKCPSPDCFNIAFFQLSWTFMKDDLMNVFDEFFYNGKLTTSISCTFITLVPKKDNFIKVHCFRPISLISGVCKSITKVLFRILGEVLLDTFFENQIAIKLDSSFGVVLCLPCSSSKKSLPCCTNAIELGKSSRKLLWQTPPLPRGNRTFFIRNFLRISYTRNSSIYWLITMA